MKIIDLTLTYQQGMRGVEFETSRTVDKDGWNAKILHLYSHAGTHMDAPFHFDVSDQTIEEFDPARFVCDAWVVPVTIAPKKKIMPADLGRFRELIKAGDGVILKTGWSRYVDEEKYRAQLPGIDESLALFLVQRRINLLGVEPPSVADVTDRKELTKIHQILLGGDVIIVEGLTNLEAVSAEKLQLIALPLKIKGGDGAPARVIAIENQTSQYS